MTTVHKIYLSICGVLLVGLIVAGIAYKVKSVRAEEAQKTADKVLAVKDQAMADRDKAFQDFQTKILQQIADIKTAKQGIQILQPIISPQGQAAPTMITKGDLGPEAQKSIPGPPDTSLHVLTDDQIINAAKRELQCQATEAGLTKCNKDKADMQGKIDALTKANNDWKKAGAAGPWIGGLGVAKNAGGNGYTPTMLFGRRITSQFGIMGGVQGRGDLSLWATWNFGSPKK